MVWLVGSGSSEWWWCCCCCSVEFSWLVVACKLTALVMFRKPHESLCSHYSPKTVDYTEKLWRWWLVVVWMHGWCCCRGDQPAKKNKLVSSLLAKINFLFQENRERKHTEKMLTNVCFSMWTYHRRASERIDGVNELDPKESEMDPNRNGTDKFKTWRVHASVPDSWGNTRENPVNQVWANSESKKN